ncbi:MULTISPECIES: hypothetical protein [unclassified Frankia]|uniref:hypothetical protein n=1 Tax=unclassified Frankia TaxID=2632575 RepID=UPI002AD3048E|nr:MULTISPECIES: hypothetical protein [unclassified Frankia]
MAVLGIGIGAVLQVLVFLVAVPIALVAFALSWLLPEIRLRHTTIETADLPAQKK